MAQFTINISDEQVQRIANAFDKVWPGERGETPPAQFIRDKLREFIKGVVKQAEVDFTLREQEQQLRRGFTPPDVT